MVTVKKTYLGDGAYAEIVDNRIILTAENGVRVTDRIVLEPEVWGALLRYLADEPKRSNDDDDET